MYCMNLACARSHNSTSFRIDKQQPRNRYTCYSPLCSSFDTPTYIPTYSNWLTRYGNPSDIRFQLYPEISSSVSYPRADGRLQIRRQDRQAFSEVQPQFSQPLSRGLPNVGEDGGGCHSRSMLSCQDRLTELLSGVAFVLGEQLGLKGGHSEESSPSFHEPALTHAAAMS